MRPKLINLQIIKNAKYRIDKTNLLIKDKNNYYANLSILIIIIIFCYFMYYRYINKNNFVKNKQKKTQEFEKQLFNYYNQIKRNELLDILNKEPTNNIMNINYPPIIY